MPEISYCGWCGARLTTRSVGGRERPACAADGCGFVVWGNPTPVVAAIVELDGTVVLVRNHGWPEKWFGLVTGFLEPGETPEQAVRREVEEELALDAEKVAFLGVYSFFERNELIIAYHVCGRGEIVLGDELEDSKRIPVDKLRPWPFGTGQAVRDWLERRHSGASTPG